MDNDKDTIDEFYISPLDSNQISTINLEDLIKDLNLPPLDMYSTSLSSSTLQGTGQNTITISNSGSNPTYVTNTPYYYQNSPMTAVPNWQAPHTLKNTFQVDGDAEFNGDIKWKGRSLEQMLETIERRLNILVPDPEKLEHYEALKKAYEHYKTLEALCDKPNKEEDK